MNTKFGASLQVIVLLEGDSFTFYSTFDKLIWVQNQIKQNLLKID